MSYEYYSVQPSWEVLIKPFWTITFVWPDIHTVLTTSTWTVSWTVVQEVAYQVSCEELHVDAASAPPPHQFDPFNS